MGVAESVWTGSILALDGVAFDADAAAPQCFPDLNLDLVCAQLFQGCEEYALTAVFHQPLHDAEAVAYRQAACRELERPEVADAVRGFAEGMVTVRRRLHIAAQVRDRHQRAAWFLEAVDTYRKTLTRLDAELSALELESLALSGLRAYLRDLLESPAYAELASEATRVADGLARLRYAVAIDGLRVTVAPYEEEPDLTSQIEATFARFRQGDVKDHRVDFGRRGGMSVVEERILRVVAELFPEPFARAADFFERHWQSFLDETIGRFDREVQFYLAYLEYIEPLAASGLRFCYPAVSTTSKRERVCDTFDLALARKLRPADQAIVVNDIELAPDERVIVVSGPNQGGKTTLARTFGQLHHLAALGLPVPGSEAALFLPDQIFTHFEREEDLATLRSKFEDELIRLREILEAATADSVLVMNESFSATALQDARWVGTRLLRTIIDRDLICLCVSFIDDLAAAGETVVSMMSTVDPADPALRTFKVVRKPADGLAYAQALADKHGLGYRQLSRRLTR